jgi:hypothetical protein
MRPAPIHPSWGFRLAMLTVAGVLLGAFTRTAIAAGHGGGTAADLLFRYVNESWLPVWLPVYLSVPFFVAATLCPGQRLYAVLYLLAVSGVLFGWSYMFMVSDLKGMTLSSSTPFLASVVTAVVAIGFKLRNQKHGTPGKGFEVVSTSTDSNP